MDPAVRSFLESLPAERREPVERLRSCVADNLPEGFAEQASSGMLSFVVPVSAYPKGYHCTPGQPLPFISVASQRNHIALYHMALYADKELLEWFIAEWPKHSSSKLDMGKSCIRFKPNADLPYVLIGQLAARYSPSDWIRRYEAVLER